MNARRTYIGYFSFLAIILIVVGYAGRNVLFRPWTERTWVSLTVASGRIYIFGGRNENHELMPDILALNPAANSLRHVGNEPHGLFGCGAATLDGAIYVAGGTDNRSVSSQVDRFNPRTKRLKPIGRLPGPRSFGALVSDHHHLYYLGGWNGSSTSGDIIEIEPATGTTEVVGHLPQPLEQFAATTASGLVYLVGGMDGAGNFVRTIYGIELPTGRLVASGRLATAAARMSAASERNEVYIAGGWNGSALHWLYGFKTGTSEIEPQQLIELRYPILDSSLADLDNELYLIGGSEKRFRRQVQVLRIDPRSFEVRELRLKSYVWS